MSVYWTWRYCYYFFIIIILTDMKMLRIQLNKLNCIYYNWKCSNWKLRFSKLWNMMVKKWSEDCVTSRLISSFYLRILIQETHKLLNMICSNKYQESILHCNGSRDINNNTVKFPYIFHNPNQKISRQSQNQKQSKNNR